MHSLRPECKHSTNKELQPFRWNFFLCIQGQASGYQISDRHTAPSESCSHNSSIHWWHGMMAMAASPDSTSGVKNVANYESSCKREESTEAVFLSSFTVLRKGYEAASKDFEPQDLDVSVVGRSFMITGANSGIGRATAIAVAKQGRSQVRSGCECKKILSVLCSFSGGTVHMVCRNRERAEEARECIVNESGNTVSVSLCQENNAKHAQITDMHGPYRRFTSILWTWQRRVKFGSLLKASSRSTHRWTCWLVVFFWLVDWLSVQPGWHELATFFCDLR